MKTETLYRIWGYVGLFLFTFVLASLLMEAGHCQTVLMPLPRQCFPDNLSAGRPLAGGKIFTYQAGTSIQQATFTDATGLVQNSNPVILDAAGCTSIWLTSGQAYRFVAQNSVGVQEWSTDQVSGLATAGAALNQSLTTVSSSSTPTFTALGQYQVFKMTLTGNVTSSTLTMTGVTVPSLVTFELTQDGTGGRTFVWPLNVSGTAPVSLTPNAVTTESFFWDGTTAWATANLAAYQTTNNTFIGSNNFKTQNNIVYASQFSGADIFAQANTAAATLGASGGHVIIQAGSYSSTTSLVCVSNIWFDFQGVAIAWTGGAGSKAIKCGTTTLGGQDLQGGTISGPLEIDSNQSANSIGLYIGSPTATTGNTMHMTFRDIQIGSCYIVGEPANNGFDTGIFIDGANTAGTYYNNFYNVCASNNLHDGWDWKPTTGNNANSNTCVMCVAKYNGQDGMEIDGAFEDSFYGWDAESNSRYGIDALNARATQNNTWIGGDMETNTTADLNCVGATNFINNSFYGINILTFAGNCAGTDSVNQMMHADVGRGQHFTVSIGPLDSAATPYEFAVVNTESPASGIAVPLGLFRTAANSGQINFGSPEYPVFFPGTVAQGGGSAAFQEGSAPSGISGWDRCYADSTAHALKCSFNNGTFGEVYTGANNRDFSVSGCAPATSTDSNCTGTITVSPSFADASYFPVLTVQDTAGAFIYATITGALTSSSIPYTLTCTFNCGTIGTPQIFVHAFHP